jgi:ribosome-interacting GTPase 1
MPTNLPPECTELEKAYREAKSLKEKVKLLERYINSIPQHKGTMRLRKQLKTKLSKLRYEFDSEKTRKAGGGGTTPYDIKRAGIAQVVFLGLTQCGKSSLLGAITNAKVEAGDHPYSTLTPVVGMMDYEDVQIGLVEAPALMEKAAEGKAWGPQVLGLARNSDGILLLLNAERNPEEQLNILLNELEAAGIYPLKGRPPRIEIDNTATGGIKIFCAKSFRGDPDRIPEIVAGEGVRNAVIRILEEATEEDVRRAVSEKVIYKPLLAVLNKSDLISQDSLNVIAHKIGGRFKTICISAKMGYNIEALKKAIFEFLQIIRVYPRRPGQTQPDKPLILKRGAKVSDAASKIHTHFQRNFKFAKIWGPSAKYPGEKIGIDFMLRDKDLIELYIR